MSFNEPHEEDRTQEADSKTMEAFLKDAEAKFNRVPGVKPYKSDDTINETTTYTVTKPGEYPPNPSPLDKTPDVYTLKITKPLRGSGPIVTEISHTSRVVEPGQETTNHRDWVRFHTKEGFFGKKKTVTVDRGGSSSSGTVSIYGDTSSVSEHSDDSAAPFALAKGILENFSKDVPTT